MPLTEKGKEIMAAMVREYGSEEKAKEVFYASKNSGKITGVDEDPMEQKPKHRFYVTEQLSENMAMLPSGYLLCTNVPITRTGTFSYKGNELLGQDGKPLVEPSMDGMVKIQRDEAEVFAENTIKSFEGVPFTLTHPDGFVGPENWQELSHGHAQNVRRGENGQGDLLLCDILVTTEKAIKAILEEKQRELSCGYDAEYLQLSPGVGKQTDIIANHIALVSKGRAGGKCSIQDKACTGCGKCTCGKNKLTKDHNEQEVGMTVKEMKERFVKFFDAMEETEEEKVARLAKEAEEKEKETKDAVALQIKDQGEEIAGLDARLKKIEDMLEELLSEDETEDADPDAEAEAKKKAEEEAAAKAKGEEEAAAKKAEDDAAELEAAEKKKKEEEEKEAEEKKTVDSAWSELMSRADILVPGIRLSKPTKDHLKTLDEIKIDVLKKAVSGGDKDVLTPVLGSKKFRAMTTDALDVAFVAASELVASKRNSKIQVGDGSRLKVHDFAEAKTVADINKANKEFYGPKK